MSKPTKGPWHWCIDPRSKNIELRGHGACGTETILCPRRAGMNGATLYFNDSGLLDPAMKFAHVVEGREHHSDWYQTINHADANLIAASPELYEVAKRYEAWEAKLIMHSAAWEDGLPKFTQDLLDEWMEIQELRNAAVKKAAGEPCEGRR